ncbi:hypothetical protein B0O80DRAFT_454885 [Mortierella sp. GBAus27b]|nr:hypothetical protein BGX31_002434 [Mortierella sp. GBA43]KAI8351856.1 hypothetical protein B0O80DRAFT_454885 [Mortierella sp. GBAus27b]
MATAKALDLPEILAKIGSHITIWQPAGYNCYDFRPQHMLPCLLVSRNFYNTFLPILWYTLDEDAMDVVPVEILRNHTSHFRLYFHYGYRSTPPIKTLSCTRLTQLIFAQYYSLKKQDFRVIKHNPDLKRLDVAEISWDDCSDILNSLKRLEHLRLDLAIARTDHGSFQQLLQPVSETLQVLHLTWNEGAPSFQGVVLPNLKELYTNPADPQEAIDLLRGCPNLESLGSPSLPAESSSTFIPALKTGVCTRIKGLNLVVSAEEQGELAEAIEGCTRLQRLDVAVLKSEDCLVRAISHHASSLTYLSFQVLTLPLPTLFQILGSCGQLRDVQVQDIGYKDMKLLTSKVNWKNPGVLERLRMTSDGFTQRRGGEETTKLRVQNRLKVLENPGNAPDVYLHGWRIPPGSRGRIFSREFLGSLFVGAAGFCRLRTILINSIVYTRPSFLTE